MSWLVACDTGKIAGGALGRIRQAGKRGGVGLHVLNNLRLHLEGVLERRHRVLPALLGVRESASCSPCRRDRTGIGLRDHAAMVELTLKAMPCA